MDFKSRHIFLALGFMCIFAVLVFTFLDQFLLHRESIPYSQLILCLVAFIMLFTYQNLKISELQKQVKKLSEKSQAPFPSKKK